MEQPSTFLGKLRNAQQSLEVSDLAAASNVLMRSSSLVLRFLLSVYIIKQIGLEATGTYGLVQALVTAAPALLGFGLNYFVIRDVASLSRLSAGVLIKTRLALSVICLAVASAVVAALMVGEFVPVPPLIGLVVLIIWLETVSADIQVPLVGRGMVLQANALFFIRSAGWVPFAIGLGLLFPALRTIEVVLIAWLCAYPATFILLLFFLKEWPLRDIALAPFKFRWAGLRLRKCWLIFVSEICTAASVYGDRYVVLFFLGLSATGVYTFYLSLATALHTLISTAVVQIAAPSLFKSYQSGSLGKWRDVMSKQYAKLTIVGLGLGFAVFGAGLVLINAMEIREVKDHQFVFALLIIAAIVRSHASLTYLGLNSLRKDKQNALIKLAGLAVTVLALVVFTSNFGMTGAGLAGVISSGLLALYSCYVLYTEVSKTKRFHQLDFSPANTFHHAANEFFSPIKYIYKQIVSTAPPRLATHIQYFKFHRRFANLNRPTTFNEKLIARKLSWRETDHDPRFVVLSDKIKAKGHASKVLGPDWVTPTLWHGTDLDRCPELPYPFVIKLNNASNRNIFVFGPDDFERAKHSCPTWLGERWERRLSEEWYNHIEPELMIEPFLGVQSSNDELSVPIDYKFFCFHQKIVCIEAVVGRCEENRRSFFDTKWEKLDFKFRFAKEEVFLPPPQHLIEMITAAKKLSMGFEFVRVDLYDLPDGPRFGEMTFCPGSGFGVFRPRSADHWLGSHWKPFNTF
ncbi:ATP-grasp fold amidoligase family protein [Roseibium sp.]|uniref:ATP-grasp fold amidoligase family protein n=1 Tax=Roseibium sp. TaxID=1936156 RepID=UPI003D0C33D2